MRAIPFALGRVYANPSQFNTVLLVEAARWPNPARDAVAETRAWLASVMFAIRRAKLDRRAARV